MTKTLTGKNGFQQPAAENFQEGSTGIRIGRGVKNHWLRGYIRKYARPHVINCTNSENFTCNMGTQAILVTHPLAMNSLDWWTPSWNQVNQMYLVQTGTGSGLIAGTPAANDRLIINYIHIRTMLRNMATVKIHVKFYDLVPRHDQQAATGTPLDPISAWNQGYTDESWNATAGSGAANSATVGATPFQSEKFCEYYRVKKVHDIAMQPGGQHTHYTRIRPGRMWKRYSAQNWVQMAGLSWTGMVVMYGDVVKGTGGVTTGQGELSIVSSSNISFTTVSKVMKTVTTYDALPTVTAPALVDEATGQIVTDIIV